MTEHRLADAFVELADAPAEWSDLPGFLDRFAERAAQLVGARAAVALLAARDRAPAVAGSGTPGLAELELESLARGEGMAMLCVRSRRDVSEMGLAGAVARHRWPYYAPRAEKAGLHRAEALPLQAGGRCLGALVLYYRSEPALGAESRAIARSLVDAAAIALTRGLELAASRTLTAQLQQALTSRVVIEQAKGVLATRLSVSVDEAFQVLRGHARSTRRPLSDVAREVVAGTLRIEPGATRGSGRGHGKPAREDAVTADD